MTLKKLSVWLVIMSFSLILKSYAGVMPSQSRVVYAASDSDKSLMLANTNHYPVVVQTWIDKGEGTPDARDVPFISIPPVFRLDPSSVKGVRIIYNKARLPEDRESLFWFNIYEIPPERKGSAFDNSVLVTMNTQIKLFYRPSGITITPSQAVVGVVCKKADRRSLSCFNSSPVHISVEKLEVGQDASGGQSAVNKDLILPPFSHTLYHFNNEINGQNGVKIYYVDDSGNHQAYKLH